MTNLIGFFVNRFVFAISIFIALVFFGMVSFTTIGVDLLPNFELSFVTVNTTYAGAGAEEVSKQVSEPIEDALSTLPGISSLESYSFEGLSVVFVEFNASVNGDQAAVDVSQRVNAVLGQLPDDAGSPSVQKLDPNDEPILNVALSAPGESVQNIQKFAEDILEPDLQRVNGVADVSLIGPIDREIQILLDRGALEAYNLSPAAVAGAIASNSSEVPLGNLTIGGDRILLTGRNTFKTVDELERLLVDSERGLYMTDIAVVRDTSAEITAYSRLNGEPVVVMSVQKQSGSNSVETASNIRKRLASYDLPDGYSARIVADSTPFIASTVADTSRELVRSVFIVAFIVLLFIGRLGSTFSVILAIPISFAGALILFGVFGFTFNIITLLAVTVAVGLVVDDSIVIAESIDRYREEGASKKEAVVKGAGEVSLAVLASTLSLLAVFLPISFLPGILGQFFREFGLTLTATILFSYFEALFFLTVRLAYMPNPLPPGPKEIGWSITRLFRNVAWLPKHMSAYLKFRPYIIGIASFVLIFAGMYAAAFFANNPTIDAALFNLFDSITSILPANVQTILGIQAADSYSSSEAIKLLGLGAAVPALVLLLFPFLISLVLYLLRLGMSVVRVPVFLVGGVVRALFHAVDWFVNGLRNGYTKILKGLLRAPYVVLIFAGLLVLSIVPLIGSGRIGFSFSPALDSGQVGITLELPDGTDLNTTNDVAGRIEEYLQKQPEVDVTLLNIGINASDIGNIATAQRAEFTLELVPKQQRSRRDSELALAWVEEVKALVADRPEAKITGAAIQDAGPPEAADYSTVLASNDITLLREKDRIARTALEGVDYLGNVGSNFDSIVSERVFQVDTSKLDGTGLSVSDIYSILRAYNVGINASNLRDSGNEYPIIVKMNPEAIRDQQTLLSLPIFAPVLGRNLSIGELGSFEIFEAPSTIQRIGQSYVAEIDADVLPGAPPTSTRNTLLDKVLEEANVYSDGVGKAKASGLDLTGDLILYTPIAFALALILNYLVIASQFNSFKFPVYLLLTVPLALVGTLWLFGITGIPLDVNSVLGIVILTGLVTKNAILLLDIVINKDQQLQGENLHDMLLRAARLRLRPILMTTTTLIAISIPLLFGTGDGSEFRRPLGLVIFAGVTTSALLTLFVIPCAFYFFEKKNFAAQLLSERAAGKTTFHEGNLALEGKGLDGKTLTPEMASD